MKIIGVLKTFWSNCVCWADGDEAPKRRRRRLKIEDCCTESACDWPEGCQRTEPDALISVSQVLHVYCPNHLTNALYPQEIKAPCTNSACAPRICPQDEKLQDLVALERLTQAAARSFTAQTLHNWLFHFLWITTLIIISYLTSLNLTLQLYFLLFKDQVPVYILLPSFFFNIYHPHQPQHDTTLK